MGNIRQYKLFIASPGDVEEERQVIRDVCVDINRNPLVMDKEVSFLVQGWKDLGPVPGRPQDTINKLVKVCHVFVCIFHKRFGTDAGKGEVATLEEFSLAYEKWRETRKPHIMFYFKQPENISVEEVEELSKVLKFKEEIENEHLLLFNQFDTLENFAKLFKSHLEKWIVDNSNSHNMKATTIIDPPLIDSPSRHSPWNVPFRENTNFTGREEQLKQLHQGLQPDDGSIVGPVLGISGLGGTGKTQLAVKYAHRHKQDYPSGILWVRAENNVLEEYGVLGDELGLKLHSQLQLESQCQVVRRNLERWTNPGLLVLDNLDDKKDYEEIKKYLPTTGPCRILVTSRHKNMISGQGIELDVLSPSDALELLLKESERSNEGEDGERICRMMGNLPLALELAGAYLRKHKSRISMSLYADKLEKIGVLEHRFQDRTDKLEHTDHIASLKATLAINEELLGDMKVQTVLAGLVCFAPENISYEMLIKVSKLDEDDFINALSDLEEFSLVKDKDRRLCIHRLLREAIPEQLDSELFQKVQADFISVFETWSNICEDESKIKETTLEIPHLIEAVKLAQNKNLWPSSFDLAIKLGRYYGNIGRYSEKIKWISSCESFTRENSDPARLGLLLNHQGSISNNLGKYQEAIEYLEQALKIRKETYDDKHPDVAQSLSDLGFSWGYLGEYHKEMKFNEQALEIRKAAYGDKHSDVALSLNNLGSTWDKLGKHHKALKLYEQALEINKEIYGGRHPNIASILNNLGLAWDKLGKHHKAIKLYELTLEIEKEIYGEHPDIAISLNNLGSAWESIRDYKNAVNCYEQALEIRIEFLGTNHPYTIRTKKNLEFCSKKQERKKKRGKIRR